LGATAKHLQGGGAKRTMKAFRVLWLVCIGWWLAPIWVGVAFFLMLSVVGWPLAYKMFDSTYAVLTGDFD